MKAILMAVVVGVSMAAGAAYGDLASWLDSATFEDVATPYNEAAPDFTWWEDGFYWGNLEHYNGFAYGYLSDGDPANWGTADFAVGHWKVGGYADYNSVYGNNLVYDPPYGDKFAFAGKPDITYAVQQDDGGDFIFDGMADHTWSFATYGETVTLTVTGYLDGAEVGEWSSAFPVPDETPDLMQVMTADATVDRLVFSWEGTTDRNLNGIVPEGWMIDSTPEPVSMVMLGCLGAGMAVARRLRRK